MFTLLLQLHIFDYMLYYVIPVILLYNFPIIFDCFIGMDDEVQDLHLLEFKSYEDYLDSFINELDLKYLRSIEIARKLVECGHRTTTAVLSRQEFFSRISAVKAFLNPVQEDRQLYSEGLLITDKVLKELADRERANILGVLTVSFV